MSISVKSPLRYPGGKFRARKILESYLPDDVHHVASPFLGGGSFELYLTNKDIQVTAFDGFVLLANFWNVLLNNPHELHDEIMKWFGKMDASIFLEMKKELISKQEDVEVVKGNIELASKFFIVNRCSFSGATLSGGYSRESKETRFTLSSIQKINDFNNENLHFKYGLFEGSLNPSMRESGIDFLFLDPPYLLENGKNKLYGIGGSMHNSFNHSLLKEKVVSTGLPFLITYNNNEIIRDMWREYDIVDAEWAYGMNKSKKSSEIIIKSY